MDRRTRTTLTLLAGLALWLLHTPIETQAQTGEWEPAGDENGIVIHTRRSEDSPILAFRGVMSVPQPIEAVEAVLRDIERYPDWYARCEVARTVDSSPPNWRIVYMELDMPFPVTDRDAAVRVDRTARSDGSVVLRIRTAADAVPPADDFVRMKKVEGSWTLEPTPQGGTRVTYQQENDAGGGIPSWLANLVVTDQPTATLAGLRRMLEEEH